jgi:hypothetical protein
MEGTPARLFAGPMVSSSRLAGRIRGSTTAPPRTMRPASLHRDNGELSTALNCVREFGRWIRNADAKAAALAALHGVLLPVLTNGIPKGRIPLTAWWACGPLMLSAAASVGTLICLIGTQLPRTRVSTGAAASRLAFPAVARMRPAELLRPASSRLLRAHAWHQAAALAEIAARKFRWLRRATFTTALTVAAFLVWILVSVITAQS